MKKLLLVSFLLLITATAAAQLKQSKTESVKKPRVVNIINFVRLLEPRGVSLTRDVLYQTVVNQLEEMKANKLGGTFLLQYDALMEPRYQALLKNLPEEIEIGAWFEIPQPLAEKAGMKWRGRYPWDWHVNVGFSVGYTPQERIKLVDIYFADFKNIFGYYPKSVGCWFIDEISLNYMYEKYGIIASCNCRDQIGVDGYTLWGGYWNKAYYPSKDNVYMPAQNLKNQIPVPVFRMLGSDPIRQTDVTTMEPAIENDGGSDSNYVDWYFSQFINGPCMEYAYVQIGQENSFGWKRLGKGYTYQMKCIAKLRDEKKIKTETLSETGSWFKQKYKVTPATSVTALNGMNGDNRKTVWFNSRFYRANLLWQNGTLHFRDIHLFNETLKSIYNNEAAATTTCRYSTLPFIDGIVWSNDSITAGLYLKAIIDGKEQLVEGGTPIVNDSQEGKLFITWPLTNIDGNFTIEFTERGITMNLKSSKTKNWFLDLIAPGDTKTAITKIEHNKIECNSENTKYNISLSIGIASFGQEMFLFRLSHNKRLINLNFSNW